MMQTTDARLRSFHAQRVCRRAEAPSHDTLVTLGDRVVFVGDEEQACARFPDAERIDLTDTFLLPGFNDAHMHPSYAAEYSIHVNLGPDRVRDRQAAISALGKRASESPAGEWVRAVRYDHAKTTDDRLLTRQDLDAVSTGHPVYVRHISGHIGVANSAALARFGLTDEIPDPQGGRYGRDADARLDGTLHGEANRAFAMQLPAPTLEERLQGLSTAFQGFHAAGITSLTDAMVRPATLELFQEAAARQELTARVGLLVWHEFFELARGLGLRSDFGSERLRYVGIKLVLDGSVAGGTCYVDEPFVGTDDHGLLHIPVTELDELVEAVHRSGTRIAVHANGDRAIGLLLDAIESAQTRYPRPELRHRIEHGTLLNDVLIRRIRRNNLIVVPLLSYIRFHGPAMRKFFGAARAEQMVACRSLLDAGVTVSGSSDYGAGPFEPLANIQSSVTRLDEGGEPVGASQRVSVAEAIDMYTIGAAAAAGEEAIKGRLEPGYLGDFVALDRDPYETPETELHSVQVLSTWVGARRVWPDPE